MDTERIQKICDDYLAYYRSLEYHEDNDWQYYIYETVLKAVYGNDIFDKLRAVDKQKAIAHKHKVIKKLLSELE